MIQKTVTLVFVLALCEPCFAQTQDTLRIHTYQFALPDISTSDSSLRERFVQNYADSLNNYDMNMSFPSFLFQYDFDSRHSSYWMSTHKPISLRKLIFNRVQNKLLLKSVINRTSEPSLDKVIVPDEFSGIWIPFYEYSTRALAKIRLEEILNFEE